MTHHLTE